MDNINVQSAPMDLPALRERQFQQNASQDPMLYQVPQHVPNVMQAASVLMVKLRNVLVALTVMLGRTNVHYAPLAFSVTVDLKSLVLLDFTV